MAVKEWSTTAADNDDADGTINWLEGMAPSGVNDSARAMMAAIASWYAQIKAGTVIGTVGGTADAITLTCSPTVSALAAGQRYLFKAPGTNTGAVTLNVDSIGAVALRYKDVALIAGDLVTNDYVLATFDGTRFQMVNPPRLSWATTDVTTDSTGGAVGDFIPFLDASQSNALNKVTVQDLFNNVMTGLTADTAPVITDSLLTYDLSATAAKTTTISDFYKTINGLTADASPVATTDYVVTYDASASGPKKVLLNLVAPAASQAEQETGTSTLVFVTPGRQHYHDSAAKAWLTGDYAGGGTPSPASDSFNLSSVSDTGTGLMTVNFTTSFSSANYVQSGMCQRASANSGLWPSIHQGTDPTSSACAVAFVSDGASNTDPSFYSSVFHGDQ